MSILGPFRKDTQVEVSCTDARKMGLLPPIRESGDIAGTPGCKVIGPCGEAEVECGVIIAKRHIHLGDVVVRVRSDFAAAMHIDTDEANAAGLTGGLVYGTIIA